MFRILKKTPQKTLLPTEIYVAPLDLHIKLTRHRRARRFILKQDIKNGGFALTLPPRGTLRQAESFINEHLDWLRRHQVAAPMLKKFEDGDLVHLYGRPLTLHNNPQKLRGLPEITADDRLIVPGDPRHLHRKTGDFLKSDFKAAISDLAHAKAHEIDKIIRRIRIADQKTRWGSCSSTGTLSFSCRLVFAPLFVIDYVAAHEVAHMIHMDHSDRFWQLCRALSAEGDRVTEAKHWLKTNDAITMKYLF